MDEECRLCDGTGEIWHQPIDVPGVAYESYKCPSCHGSGRKATPPSSKRGHTQCYSRHSANVHTREGTHQPSSFPSISDRPF